jgi:hypothetical protein
MRCFIVRHRRLHRIKERAIRRKSCRFTDHGTLPKRRRWARKRIDVIGQNSGTACSAAPEFGVPNGRIPFCAGSRLVTPNRIEAQHEGTE